MVGFGKFQIWQSLMILVKLDKIHIKVSPKLAKKKGFPDKKTGLFLFPVLLRISYWRHSFYSCYLIEDIYKFKTLNQPLVGPFRKYFWERALLRKAHFLQQSPEHAFFTGWIKNRNEKNFFEGQIYSKSWISHRVVVNPQFKVYCGKICA